jgi:glutathione S-transferase
MQLDFEHVPTNFRGENKAPEYLAINPNGRIPAMVDGDLVLFESMAINLYLAKQYGPSLVASGSSSRGEGRSMVSLGYQ